jgi:hypothetical protein
MQYCSHSRFGPAEAVLYSTHAEYAVPLAFLLLNHRLRGSATPVCNVQILNALGRFRRLGGQLFYEEVTRSGDAGCRLQPWVEASQESDSSRSRLDLHNLS